jgi:hypothetical protein
MSSQSPKSIPTLPLKLVVHELTLLCCPLTMMPCRPLLLAVQPVAFFLFTLEGYTVVVGPIEACAHANDLRLAAAPLQARVVEIREINPCIAVVVVVTTGNDDVASGLL